MAALTDLDTGMRIQELLNLRWPDVDFDNLRMPLVTQELITPTKQPGLLTVPKR
jgi:integrase